MATCLPRADIDQQLLADIDQKLLADIDQLPILPADIDQLAADIDQLPLLLADIDQMSLADIDQMEADIDQLPLLLADMCSLTMAEPPHMSRNPIHLRRTRWKEANWLLVTFFCGLRVPLLASLKTTFKSSFHKELVFCHYISVG